MSLDEFHAILYKFAKASVEAKSAFDTEACIKSAKFFGKKHRDEPCLLFHCAASLLPKEDVSNSIFSGNFLLVPGKSSKVKLILCSSPTISLQLDFSSAFYLYKSVTLYYHKKLISRAKVPDDSLTLDGQMQSLQQFITTRKCSARVVIEIFDAFASSKLKYDEQSLKLALPNMDCCEIDGILASDAWIQCVSRLSKNCKYSSSKNVGFWSSLKDIKLPIKSDSLILVYLAFFRRRIYAFDHFMPSQIIDSPISAESCLDYLSEIYPSMLFRFTENTLICSLAIKPNVNSDGSSDISLLAARESLALNFISTFTELLHESGEFVLLTIFLQGLVDKEVSKSPEWQMGILGIISKLVLLMSDRRVSLYFKDVLCLLDAAISNTKSVAWDEYSCKNCLDSAMKLLHLVNDDKLRAPKLTQILIIVMEKALKDVPKVFFDAMRMQKDYIDRLVSNQDMTESNIKAMVFFTKIFPEMKWSWAEKMTMLFKGNFSISTKLKFWLAILKTNLDEIIRENANKAIISILAEPQCSMRKCKKNFKTKVVHKFLRICQADTHDLQMQQLPMALCTLLSANPENQSLKTPGVIHFLTHKFGLGLLIEKTRIHTLELECKLAEYLETLNIPIDHYHLDQSDNAYESRISWLSAKVILNVSNDCGTGLCDNDVRLLSNLPFTKAFMNLPSWAHYQISIAVEILAKEAATIVQIRRCAPSSTMIGEKFYLDCPGWSHARKLRGDPNYSAIFDQMDLPEYASVPMIKGPRRRRLAISNCDEAIPVLQTISLWGGQIDHVVRHFTGKRDLTRILSILSISRTCNPNHREIPYLEEQVRQCIRQKMTLLFNDLTFKRRMKRLLSSS